MLEALYDAPRAASLHGRARHGQHFEKMREAIDRLNGRLRGSRVLTAGLVRPGANPPTEWQEGPVEVWWSDGAWRVDNELGRTVRADGQVLRFHPGTSGVITSEDEQPTEPFDGLAMYLAPAAWLGSLRFPIIEDVAHQGRPCWHAMAEPVQTRQLPVSMLMLGALDFELWIDRVTGIVVRCEGRLDGELASRFIVDDLVVGEPIGSEVFALATPDGSPIRTQGELWLEVLRSRGVDVSGIDPSDPDAIQQAMRSSTSRFGQPRDVEQLAAKGWSTVRDTDRKRLDHGQKIHMASRSLLPNRAVDVRGLKAT